MHPFFKQLPPAERNMDPRVPVPAAGFEQENLHRWVFGQASREGTPGRACAADDVIVCICFRHAADGASADVSLSVGPVEKPLDKVISRRGRPVQPGGSIIAPSVANA